MYSADAAAAAGDDADAEVVWTVRRCAAVRRRVSSTVLNILHSVSHTNTQTSIY